MMKFAIIDLFSIRSSLASAQLGRKTTDSLEPCAIREEVKKSEVEEYHNPCTARRQRLSSYLKGTVMMA